VWRWHQLARRLYYCRRQ